MAQPAAKLLTGFFVVAALLVVAALGNHAEPAPARVAALAEPKRL